MLVLQRNDKISVIVIATAVTNQETRSLESVALQSKMTDLYKAFLKIVDESQVESLMDPTTNQLVEILAEKSRKGNFVILYFVGYENANLIIQSVPDNNSVFLVIYIDGSIQNPNQIQKRYEEKGLKYHLTVANYRGSRSLNSIPDFKFTDLFIQTLESSAIKENNTLSPDDVFEILSLELDKENANKPFLKRSSEKLLFNFFDNSSSRGVISYSHSSTSDSFVLQDSLEFDETRLFDEIYFDKGKGISEPLFLIGRENELYDILRTISDARSVILFGPRWMGKTSVMKSIASRSVHSAFRIDLNKNHFVYKDMSLVDSPNELYESIVKEVFAENEFKKQRIKGFKEIRKLLDNTESRLILILDHFDATLSNRFFKDSFYRHLRDAATRENLTVVMSELTGRDIGLKDVEVKNNKGKHYLTFGQPFHLDFLNDNHVERFLFFDYYRKSIPYQKDLLSLARYLGGRHPFFLRIVRKNIWQVIDSNDYQTKDTLLDIVKRNYELEAIPYYRSLLLLDKKDKNLFQEIISGNREVLRYDRVNRLKSLLTLNDNDEVLFLSDHFLFYYKNSYSNV